MVGLTGLPHKSLSTPIFHRQRVFPTHVNQDIRLKDF